MITINLKNNCVGYVFHDDLWEGNFDTLEDVYVELPFDINSFLEQALLNEDYPIDGTMAEKYVEGNPCSDLT